ncbi:hypothetical protein BDZ94DRAFT_1303829 [Collybia nuda]|uniref:DUF3074 domain-containing protein n=1 Tax=Collybia nuda TaxID=64659 RepID=A0A9P6CQT5_9AGAR|nr:hypothetical protein BDZ94DRAFT_1303829 [Collybia nuda]
MSEDFKLTITPLKPKAVPPETTIIAAAQNLIESTSTWTRGKTYYKTVKTYRKNKEPGDGASWHCRVSEHIPTEATFEQLWDKLGKDKMMNEKEFIPEIQKVAKVKDVSPTSSIWTTYYSLKRPISPRVFTVLQVIHLVDASPRSGMIVSIPIDLSEDKDLEKLEEKGVRGRYVSVERIMELENGETEWRMATSGTPGGMIPSFITESAMASKISQSLPLQDVPHFVKWLHSLSE